MVKLIFICIILKRAHVSFETDNYALNVDNVIPYIFWYKLYVYHSSTIHLQMQSQSQSQSSNFFLLGTAFDHALALIYMYHNVPKPA